MSLSLVRNSAARFSIRAASRQAARPRLSQAFGRRGYSSGHQQAPSSDLPWLIGSVAVTVPVTAYLLYPSKSAHGDHDDHGARHAAHDESAHEPAANEESQSESAEEAAPKDQQAEEAQPVEKQEDKSEKEAEKTEEKASEEKDDSPKDDSQRDEAKSESSDSEGGAATPSSSEAGEEGEKKSDSA